MDLPYISDKKFERDDYSLRPLPVAEYEKCQFSHCEFSNSALTNAVFIDCTFNDCNLMMVKAAGTAFRGVEFTNCKLLGVRFEYADPFLFSVGFRKCMLNLTGFFKMKIKKTIFMDCAMHEVDFSGTDLTQAVLTNCDLHNSIFDNTILNKADLRTSINYTIDPEKNQVRKMKLSPDGLSGLLRKYDLDIR